MVIVEILIGFLIAVAIGLTGVGGGTLTTPLLILVLRMPAAAAVGTALTFAAVIKLVVTPIYAIRRQIDYHALGWMLLGGIPGVIAGGLVLSHVSKSMNQHLLYLILGVTIVIAAAFNIYRLLRLSGAAGSGTRPTWLAPLMFPISAEVGFTSAGSGALVSLALLGLTKLEAAEVVGTGLFFGLVVSIIGSGIQIFAGNYDGLVLAKLLVGGVLGSVAGSMLAMRIPSRPLKWALAVWLAGLGIQLCWRGLS